MTINEIREVSGLSRAEFSRKYEIPVRTLENWENGVRKCPLYIEKLLQRAVTEDKEFLPKCFDQEIMKELGGCYYHLLKVLNKRGDDPFSGLFNFPVRRFVMVYMQAAKLGIPDDLHERIATVLNFIDPEDWAAAMSKPAPMLACAYFSDGMTGDQFYNKPVKPVKHRGRPKSS